MENADVALQHNLGLGGAVVVTVYKRADGAANAKVDDDEIRKSSNFAYSPATEARYVTKEDRDKVRSKTVRSEYALGVTLEKIQSRL
jgi:sterol carrier protein 2